MQVCFALQSHEINESGQIIEKEAVKYLLFYGLEKNSYLCMILHPVLQKTLY